MSVLVLAGRELRALLGTVVGGLVLSSFLFIAGVMWVVFVEYYIADSQRLASAPYQGVDVTFATYLIAPWFSTLSTVLLFVSPAISMRLFTRDKQQHTLELLLTAPVDTWQIVAGKYLGALGFVGLMLLGTLTAPVSLALWASFDPAPFVGGYLALALQAAALLAAGMWFSALTSSQLGALIPSFALALGLFMVGVVGDGDPSSWATHLALSTHLSDPVEGLIKLTDLAYFAGFVGVFLLATHQRVELERWR